MMFMFGCSSKSGSFSSQGVSSLGKNKIFAVSANYFYEIKESNNKVLANKLNKIVKSKFLSLDSFTPNGNRVIFYLQPSVFEYLCSVKSDGSGFINLSQGLAGNSLEVALSNDGNKILFEVQTETGMHTYYVENVDGTERKKLGTLDIPPIFSPGGEEVLFAPVSSDGLSNLYITETQSSVSKNLTGDMRGTIGKYVFSPEGNKIFFLFWPEQSSSCALYSMDANGSNRKNLTIEKNIDIRDFYVLPDNKILYEANDGNANNTYNIYLMNKDGSGKLNLLQGVFGGYEITLSPNEDKLICVRSTNNDEALYSVNLSGDRVINLSQGLTDGRIMDYGISKTEDKIFFLYLKKNLESLYAVDADGNNIKKMFEVTYSKGAIGPIIFSLDGEKIAFLVSLFSQEAFSELKSENLYIVESNDGTVENLTKGMDIEAYGLIFSFSPGGNDILVKINKPDLSGTFFIDLKSGKWNNLDDVIKESVVSAMWYPY